MKSGFWYRSEVINSALVISDIVIFLEHEKQADSLPAKQNTHLLQDWPLARRVSTVKGSLIKADTIHSSAGD
jgi:hypothetical protein